MNKFRYGIVWFIVIAALAGIAASRLSSGNITILSDMLSLVGQQTVFDQKIRESAARQQSRLIIVVSAKTKPLAQTTSKQLADDLTTLDSIKTATRLPINQAVIDELTALYGQYPFTLLSKEYSEATLNNQPDKLNEYFLTTALQPGNPFVEMTITQDPTLGLANALQEKLADQSHWSNDGDALYQNVDGQYYYPLFIELAQSNLGVNQSVAIEQQIQGVLAKVQSKPEISLYRSGLLFHISESTVLAQTEITLFGTISTIIILAATLAVFRSLAPLLVIVAVMSISIAFGSAGLMSFVSELHLITFIFAVSLIGISVDYAFHVLSAAALSDHDKKQSLAKYLAPAMLMGAVTTVLGYCAMLLMPIAALHQITVFMIFGLIGAVATALLWIAPLFSGKKTTSNHRFITSLTNRIEPLRHNRNLGVVLGILTILLLVSGGKFHFNDNIKSLNSSSNELVAQEQKVQQLMGYSSYPRYIFVSESDRKSLMEKMAKITKRMDQTGLPLRTQALSQWVPPIAVQEQHQFRLQSFINNGQLDVMRSYIEPEQWQAMQPKLNHLLTPSNWPQSLYILALPSWEGKNDSKFHGIISYYSKLSQAQQDTIAAGLTDVSFIDQPQRLTESLTSVRTSLLLFFALAACAFGIILVLRYGLKSGLLALITPVCAALGSLIISQLIVGQMSIFNLLACLLIVALAVDYTVFFNEQGHKKHVVLAVLLSAVSSMAAFGMMTFSQTPAVYHFGLSTLIGIVLAVILSFITPLRPRNPNDQPM